MLYQNCQQLNIDGQFMSHIGRSRALWYVNKGLAKIVEEEPFTIQLTFRPGGDGRNGDPFYETPRENVCVVCGTSEQLTRHHVVPRTFRKHFPEDLKSNANHDVLAVCDPCHREYCIYEEEYKAILAAEFGISLDGFPQPLDKKVHRALSLFKTMLRRYEDLPHQARVSVASSLIQLVGNDNLTDEFIELVARLYVHRRDSSFGKALVEIYESDLFELMILWRQHFVDSMNPQYLPAFWDVNRRVP